MPSAVIRCPFPFPDIEATTQIKVYQEVDTKYEGKKEILVYDGLAVYDDIAKTVIGSDNKFVSLSGNIIVKGEIQTIDTDVFQGYVEIGDAKKTVQSLSKPRLFGVVYSTEIQLL